ncbi:MAG: baseplate J/gp47 family protein [Polyangiaceae bacterium]
MVIPTIQELLGDKTKESYFDELVQAAIDEKISTSAWQPGEPIRAIMVVVAFVLAKLWTLIAVPSLRAAFLDYATGAWLTLLAWTSYGVKRKGKEFATTTLTVENHSSVFVTIVPGQIRLKNTDTGKTFTNITGGSVAAWPGAPDPYYTVDLVFQADEAGTGSDTLSGAIDPSPITGPAGVFVQTNTSAILGSDEETDEALRIRCRLAMAPLSPAGPRAAYEFIALSTYRPDGTTPVGVNRVRVLDMGNCQVEVYLADRSGPTTGSLMVPGSDLFLVWQNLLKLVVPVGITAGVYAAAVVADSLTVKAYVDVDSGLSQQEALDKIAGVMAEYISKVPIGGNRTAAIVLKTDPGYLYNSELCAKASECANGIVKVVCTFGSAVTDLELPYNAIPDITVDVTVEMVKQ